MACVEINRSTDIAIVTIDNPPVNAASHDVRHGLLEAVYTTEAAQDIRAIVLTCTGRTFVAGADIREFNQPPQAPHLSAVVRAIEGASKPWVAALHGTALGGGLEIAMACHARIADINTKLGLPEVKLGLIPGAGGTVRLPRLVAAELALEMIASGKPIDAYTAYEAGLVDECVAVEGSGKHTDTLIKAALDLASRLTTPSPTLHRTPSQAGDEFQNQAARLVAKSRGQLSIQEAIHAVQRALELEPEQALAAEREAFQTLKASKQSQALRYMFFSERSTLSDPRCKLTPRNFEKVGVVGGGTMGCGIAVSCLLAGLDVTLVETNSDAFDRAQSRVDSDLAAAHQRGKISAKQLEACKALFRCRSKLEDIGSADLIIEAVFEDLDVKLEVFRELDAISDAHTILATNTSYLDVNTIAAAVSNHSRVLGLHFFSPAHIMTLLEIVVPDHIEEDCLATAAAFAKRLGKTAVLAGVCDGFIGNRIMAAYRHETECLLEDGAMPEDIDRAMTHFGFPMGIFAVQDLAGLDIAWAMRKRRRAQGAIAQGREVSIADQLCEAGRFGRKAGRGWYLYRDGAAKPDPEVAKLIKSERMRKQISASQISDDEIMQRILTVMQREAQAVIAEGIAQKDSDVDVVMVHGYGFPRWRGGPLYMLRETELKKT